MSNFRAVKDFYRQIELNIQKGQLDKALWRIQNFVDMIFCEPLNSGRIFGSARLDALCQEIGKQSLAKLPPAPPPQAVSRPTHLYIASKLQPSGGHTAVLLDIIKYSPPARHVIVLTGVAGASDHDKLKQRLSALPDVALIEAPAGDHAEKLTWLQSQIRQHHPQSVWLFNHHQDSVTIAAVQPDQNYKTVFFHHGDHHLCLGAALEFADHLDIHPMGLHDCRHLLGLKNNRYMPLVAEDKGCRSYDTALRAADGLVTCTAAGFNKIDRPYAFRYSDVVPKLLQASNGRHIHFGRLHFWTINKIRRGLRRAGIAEDRFVYIPYVPSVWQALHEYQVGLYIPSFPYGGARTLVEVMGAGIPVASHRHATLRLLSGHELAYDGVFLWDEDISLYDYVRHVSESELVRQSHLARRHYENLHHPAVLQAMLADSSFNPPMPSLSAYQTDDLQYALDNANAVSVIGAFQRMAWRLYRRWKALKG